MILQQLLKSNDNLLTKLKTEDKSSVKKHIQTLLSKRSGYAEALEEILNLLAQQSEFPLLIAVDSAQALYTTSGHPSPLNHLPLDSFAMSIPRLLLEFGSGARPIVKGGTVFAMSSSPQGDVNHTSRSLDIALGLGEPHHPYERLKHPVYYQMATKLKRFDIGRMSRDEASGVMKLLEASRILKNRKCLDLYVFNRSKGLSIAKSDSLLIEAFMAADGYAGPFVKSLKHAFAPS